LSLGTPTAASDTFFAIDKNNESQGGHQ
jgi:hypothetical protein